MIRRIWISITRLDVLAGDAGAKPFQRSDHERGWKGTMSIEVIDVCPERRTALDPTAPWLGWCIGPFKVIRSRKRLAPSGSS